jgi:cell division protein FtsB
MLKYVSQSFIRPSAQQCPMAYSRQRHSHKKEAGYILCIVVVAAILVFSLFGPGGYRELRSVRIELQERRARVDELRRSNNQRLRTIEALQSDKEEWERTAREKGYARDGEIIQHLPE